MTSALANKKSSIAHKDLNALNDDENGDYNIIDKLTYNLNHIGMTPDNLVKRDTKLDIEKLNKGQNAYKSINSISIELTIDSPKRNKKTT